MSAVVQAPRAPAELRQRSQDLVALASPSPRRPMSTLVEAHGRRLREIVAGLAESLTVSSVDLAHAAAPRVSRLGYQLDPAETPNRAAWWLVGQWLTAYAAGAIDADSRLDEAEDWFYGEADSASRRAIAPMSGVGIGLSPEETGALLPYLLDPLAQGTRRQVLASTEHRPDRTARKQAGIYYTPADAARFMAEQVISPATRTCLDPACGTGVFLRAAAAIEPSVGVYGIDLDALAVEIACFALLAGRAATHSSPWAVWHLLRTRFATADSLTVLPGTSGSDVDYRARSHEVAAITAELEDGVVPPPASAHDTYNGLGELFPGLADGADAVLCNPPYTALGRRSDFAQLRARFVSYSTAAPTISSNVFLPFVEMGSLLGTPEARSAFIVPLSIGCNQGAQFRDVRRRLAAEPGALRFAFFDRTPDAVFGDDVKTRAAIVYQDRGGEAQLGVTGFTRWTSRSRPSMWSGLRPVPLSTDIAELVPKLDHESHLPLYTALRSGTGRLGAAVLSTGRVVPTTTEVDGWPASVFVSPTAYNWLGCARSLQPVIKAGHTSRSPLAAIQFQTEAFADAAYAVIASRLTFWLWRVEGDGFHVPIAFLSGLPFDLTQLPKPAVARLASAGRARWEEAAAAPVIASNGGRRSVAFQGACHETAADMLDAVVAEAFGLEEYMSAARLAGWYHSVIVVDDREPKRRNMRKRAVTCS